MTPLQCSIVISTYNRAPQLRRLLASLARLRDASFEVVVVNGPSTDATADVLAQYSGRIKTVACSSRNLSHSRNLGIAASGGEVVAFIDDDALPADEFWLARYQQAFSEDAGQRLGVVGGSVRQGDSDYYEFNGGLTSDYALQVFDTANPAQRPGEQHRWTLRAAGGNCAFRRSALVALGGFDEQFAYYLDEADVSLRLARAGYAALNLGNNAVRHYPARASQSGSMVARPWEVIARSDLYFALKNGADAQPRRLARALWLAPRKHFVRELALFSFSGQLAARQRPGHLGRYLRGSATGLWAGLFQPRRLAELTTPPPKFLPFEPAANERPLRIALLSQTVPIQPKYGGIGRYTFDLALGLYERGHEVHVFCKDDQRLWHQGLGFLVHGVSPAAGGRGRLFDAADARPVLDKNLRHALAIVDRLRELYAQGVEFDVVHAPNWDAEGVALIRAQVYPVTIVVATPLAQSMASEHWPRTDDLQACVALDRWQIEHSDMVCTPSAGVRDTYAKTMGFAPEAMQAWRVVPQGIVPEPADRARHAGRHRLLFVGRLERRKGIHTLLAILPELLAAAPEWECHLVGDDQVPLAEGGTFRQRFLDQHARAPWLERVHFHGTVSEEALRRHYRECDLFVAPSLFESYGLIYHEAMQYGKAVVGCRVGGVPEVVADGVEGVLVAPDCPAELRDALAGLMQDEARRARLGAAGAERVHQYVNYQTMAAGMEQAYYAAIDAVGDARRARRARLWPRALPLRLPSDRVTLSGPWRPRVAGNDQDYLMGEPGASLTLTVRAPALVQITALRHSWSGVLEVSAAGGQRHYLDLFQPEDRPSDHAYRRQFAFSGPAGSPLTVTARVLAERNPASRACEVWLKEVAVVEEVELDSAQGESEDEKRQVP